MRIIAGTCRGTQLEVAKGKITRPLPDGPRQALFSSLGSEYGTPGKMPPINVVDMFAGSGSFGLECLSRGAKLACFFEKHHTAIKHLKNNISKCKMDGQAWIVAGSAYDCELPAAPDPRGWDLVYLDPPYINVEVNSMRNSVPHLLIALSDSGLIADDGWVILRHPIATDYHRCLGKLRPIREKTYGTMRFTWFRFDQELC